MANQDLVQMQSDVASIIQTYGSLFSLQRPTNVAGVMAMKTIANGIYGVFDDQVVGVFATSNGGTIVKNEKTLYTIPTMFQGKPLDIQPEDYMLTNSSSGYNWRVLNCEIYRPDGVTTIAYKLTVS